MIGPAHSDQRFVREDQRPFRNCIYVAGQLQPAHVIEKTRIEQRFAIVAALRAKIIDFRIGEVERAQEIDRCRQPQATVNCPAKGFSRNVTWNTASWSVTPALK